MVNGYNRPRLFPRCAETLIEHLLLACSKIRPSRPEYTCPENTRFWNTRTVSLNVLPAGCTSGIDKRDLQRLTDALTGLRVIQWESEQEARKKAS